ncbi:unnamed protein product [Spirodela intermedia]|uniref:Uncharacterized protein n=1 Tax=Spirodela intermedia TaxID=51605 RepID=A0A7I8K6A5_SPIIN|nr:unnamed protein product [Spirodela intermedia]
MRSKLGSLVTFPVIHLISFSPLSLPKNLWLEYLRWQVSFHMTAAFL